MKYSSQPNRPNQHADQQREYSRRRYRIRHGIPLDAPVKAVGAGRWKDNPEQCSRCTEPHAPGAELCHDHLQIMEELAREKESFDDGDDDE